MTLEMLLGQIKDPVIRENFRRVKAEIDRLDGSVSTSIIGGGSSGGGGPAAPVGEVWTSASSVIGPGATTAIDTIAMNQFKAVKYIITVYNDANQVNRVFEMKVVNKYISVDDQVFATLGSAITFSTQVIVVGADMQLQLTNNAAYSVTAKFARLVL